jgi:hypothetical protein
MGRAKLLAREVAGLPRTQEEGDILFVATAEHSLRSSLAMPMKSSPLDIEIFHQETAVKYPTFIPQQIPQIENASSKPAPPLTSSKLAQAYSPIPIRHHYHHDDSDPAAGLPPNSSHPFPLQQSNSGGSGYRAPPQPATPAPTPPPSPKPKKQQYQTDQGRPFLFPFARNQGGRNAQRLVPFAIDEADKLYNRHMYVSLALAQMWKTREECMTKESGLEKTSETEGEFESAVDMIVGFWVRHAMTDFDRSWIILTGLRYGGTITRRGFVRC